MPIANAMLDPTIPLLPNSIAASLQENLLDYLVELKFLLLFFEKPHAILSTTGCDFINAEVIEDVKKGKNPQTSAFKERNLTPIRLLATDEWAETLSHCECHEYDYKVSRKTEHLVDQSHTNEVERILRITRGPGLTGKQVERLFLASDKLTPDEQLELLGQWAIRLELNRLLGVLELSRDHKIPMIWSHINELGVSSLYARYLLLSLKSDDQGALKSSLKVALRMVEGGKLLRQILQLQVLNIAAVPVASVVEFRKKNRDLLENFLTKYRDFLSEVQVHPNDVDVLLEQHTQQLVSGLQEINSEIALRRRKRGYEFLRRLGGDNFFEAAGKCLPWASFSFLFAPWLAPVIAGAKGIGSALTGQLLTEREAQLELLYRNSSGYLWKAAHELGPKTG